MSDTTVDRRGFLGDAARLGSGTALGQALLMLSAPLLARLYAPDTFGVAAVYLSIVTVAAVVSGLRYDLAIVLPDSDDEAADLLRLHLLLTTAFSLVVGGALWWMRGTLARWLHAPLLADYAWLLGPGIFAFGVLNALNSWHTRAKRFGLMATARVVGSGGTVAAQLAAGLLGWATPGALILGGLFGRALEDLLQVRRTLEDRTRGRWRPMSAANLREQAARHRKFPLYNVWAALVNTLSWHVPAFMLAVFFDPTVVGLYAMGDRVMRAPMNILGRSFGQVFLHRGVVAHREGQLGELFLEILRMMTRLSLMPVLILSLSGEQIFTAVLGSQWSIAGVYVQILGAWAFVWFVSSPVATIMMITERQEVSLIFNAAILATRLASFVIGGVLKSPLLALALYSATGVVVYGWVLLWVGAAAGVRWHTTLRALVGAHAVPAALAAAVLVGLDLADASAWTVVAADVVLFVGYYAYVMRKYRHLLPGLRSLRSRGGPEERA